VSLIQFFILEFLKYEFKQWCCFSHACKKYACVRVRGCLVGWLSGWVSYPRFIQQKNSYLTRNYFFQLIPQKSCPHYKIIISLTARKYSELMWTDRNQLEENPSRYDKVSPTQLCTVYHIFLFLNKKISSHFDHLHEYSKINCHLKTEKDKLCAHLFFPKFVIFLYLSMLSHTMLKTFSWLKEQLYFVGKNRTLFR
jgi:hypothetical protein